MCCASFTCCCSCFISCFPSCFTPNRVHPAVQIGEGPRVPSKVAATHHAATAALAFSSVPVNLARAEVITPAMPSATLTGPTPSSSQGYAVLSRSSAASITPPAAPAAPAAPPSAALPVPLAWEPIPISVDVLAINVALGSIAAPPVTPPTPYDPFAKRIDFRNVINGIGGFTVLSMLKREAAEAEAKEAIARIIAKTMKEIK